MVLESCLEEWHFSLVGHKPKCFENETIDDQIFVQVMQFRILLFLKNKKNDRQVYNKDVEF